MDCEALLETNGNKMTRPGCCSNRQYRLRCVHSKGVLLLMAWNFFWYGSQFFGDNINLNIPINTDSVFFLGYAMYLVFPIVGWIADSCLGRYRIIIASIYIGLVSWILQGVAYALYTSSVASLLSTVIFYTSIVVSYINFAGFVSSLLPFVLDQLIEASGEELSSAVHWWFWSLQLAFLLANLIVATIQFQWVLLFHLLANLLCLLFLVVTHLVLKDWLVRGPLLSNPIKHIAKVLNYARKNKHPRNRSALTYWEEDYPSRLDLGKDKYGGPFLEEEVEDVKTVLRLLPLLVCMTAQGLTKNDDLSDHYTPSSLVYIDSLTSIDSFWSSVVLALTIPFYQLVVYPCFYRYVPSMLKRMGTGLVFIALTQCGYFILELIGHGMDDGSVGCVFSSDMSGKTLPISYAFIIIPQFCTGLGRLFLTVTSLEFVVAQSPTRMRALIIGLWYAVYGFMNLVGLNLHRPFSHISSSSITSCGFYYYLTKFVIFELLFLLFLFLSKRYRLREKNIVVNYHMFAENYYEKYIDIERQLEREGQENISNSFESR